MFGTFSHFALQHYWWAIISLLGSLLVFLLFVQGGQTLLYTLGKTELERTMLVNAIGRKWEFTFTTLVTFGGAFFASFPLFYSTSFSGAYWVWILILFCFIVQAVAYEFRSKPRNVFGPKTYEAFLYINGALGTILLGAAVSTFFTGSKFSVDFNHITNAADPVISRWESPLRGIEAAFNVQNLCLGITVFFLARILGLLFFMHTIDHEDIIQRAKKSLLRNAIPFLIVFLAFVAMLLTSKGFAADAVTGTIRYEPFKYLHNLLQMPAVAVLFVAGTLLVVAAIGMGLFTKIRAKAIWPGGFGTVFVVFSLFSLAGYNNTAYYPSVHDLQSSLTLANSSSSRYTLMIMSWVSLFVPFVLAYIYYAWKQMTRGKISADEMQHDTHIY